MLEDNELRSILSEWNFWEKPPPQSIPRVAFKHPSTLSCDLVLAIQGVRRCGKSTLMTQIMRKLNLDPKDCFFVNFEDPRLSPHLNDKLCDQIVVFAKKQRPQNKNFYFFLDEIQNVKNWEKWLHKKMERPKQDYFVITGSNATLLSGDLATALTGRHRSLELFPFDLQEYRLMKPKASLEDYLNDGGFPRTLVDPNPQKLLQEYFQDIIERDVKRYVAARSSLTLIQLAKMIFESTGSELSQRNLAKIIGVSVDTIGVYLDAFESAYLILSCPYFTFSERQRSVRNVKYYPIDLGLKNAVTTKSGRNLGKSLETVVFHHLKKMYQNVFYWTHTQEVDFVVQTRTGIVPIQVTWGKPLPRHQEALAKFKKEFPDSLEPLYITRENVEEFLQSPHLS